MAILTNGPIDSRHSAFTAGPNNAVAVLENCRYVIRAQTIGVAGLVPITLEALRLVCKPKNATSARADPNVVFVVLEEYKHLVGAQAVRIGGIVPIADKFRAISVKFKKSTAIRTYPQTAVPVFVNRARSRLEPGFRGGIKFKKYQFVVVRIDHCQTIPGCSNPKNSRVILEETNGFVGRSSSTAQWVG